MVGKRIVAGDAVMRPRLEWRNSSAAVQVVDELIAYCAFPTTMRLRPR